MKKSLIVFARCVSISATVLASQLAAAQVVDAGNTATAPKDATTQQPQTQQETQAPISTTSTLSRVSLCRRASFLIFSPAPAVQINNRLPQVMNWVMRRQVQVRVA